MSITYLEDDARSGRSEGDKSRLDFLVCQMVRNKQIHRNRRNEKDKKKIDIL